MNITDLIRGAVYLWVTLEALSNLQIYFYGYINKKKSPIIGALMLIFISIAIISTYLFACAIIRIFRPEKFAEITFWGPAFLLPIGYALDLFRRESLTDSGKKDVKPK
jgi:hypothetical protein